MSIETVKQTLPEWAKDLKLNLSSLLTPAGSPGLSEGQVWIIALASAAAARNATLTQAVAGEAATRIDVSAIQAAKASAAIMGMTNVYYRFTHLVSDKEYATMPAKLRMNVIANPGVPGIDFELASLAVSAINGCGMCLDSHEQHLRKDGVSREAIQSAVRIAATIHAVAVALEIHEAEGVTAAAA